MVSCNRNYIRNMTREPHTGEETVCWCSDLVMPLTWGCHWNLGELFERVVFGIQGGVHVCKTILFIRYSTEF